MLDQQKTISGELAVVSSQYAAEEEYWLDKFSGGHVNTRFPRTVSTKGEEEFEPGIYTFRLTDELSTGLIKMSNNSDARLHMILLAGVLAVLHRYTGNTDIVVGMPIYKQEVQGEFINTILPLRHSITKENSFKELLLQVRQNIVEADENQNYPIEMLIRKLDLSYADNRFPLFDVMVLLENVHDKKYISHIKVGLMFSFSRQESEICCQMEYNAAEYEPGGIERLGKHVNQLLENALANPDSTLLTLDMLPEEECKQLLFTFNDTEAAYPAEKTLHQCFEEQVDKTPDQVAITAENDYPGMTYRELNESANRLAHLLIGNGVSPGAVVGIMLERSVYTVVGLLAILKTGSAYLPIETGLPVERIRYMLENAGADTLLTDSGAVKEIKFTELRNFEENSSIRIIRTPQRPHIRAFDSLPAPDRWLLDLRNYRNKIGMASVNNCISMQTTRGCPYECLYCHKVWSKHHVFRSAQNIYDEIKYYYKHGVKDFAVIDDCFNLNRENSMEMFRLIVKNKLDIQLYFPNGLRGDVMTPDYIDLMVEAGTRGINLSLETAAPRLQELLKKRLDLDKFKRVVDYLAEQHPNVILELATMHGFPSETEEEAMQTLEFIKGVKWLHFPYIHILKIFPNTEMEEFALKHGISKADIMKSKDRAFHELPETLPFPKSFTRKYQADFMNNYFMSPQRLRHVIPNQLKVVSEEALVQKYNAYLPTRIDTLDDLLRFARLEDMELPLRSQWKETAVPEIFERGPDYGNADPGARRILLLDLSQHFSTHRMLYNVTEQPLGLVYLLTDLKRRFGSAIDGRIYKSGNDFNSFGELKELVEQFNPDLVGIRTLTFFREFFHETAALLRQWGVDVPIITGGPYASSDFDSILKDKNIDLVTFGEGEETLAQVIEVMLENDFRLPAAEELKKITGVAFTTNGEEQDNSREVLLLDRLAGALEGEDTRNPQPAAIGSSLAYVMYTSGSTGKPKGVMVEHRQVNNCLHWMQEKFRLKKGDVAVQRTSLTFDPSVWEIFWPLTCGAAVRVLDRDRSRDASYLVRMLAENAGASLPATIMYTPATLLTAMNHILEGKTPAPTLTLPWLVIGAEPVAMDTVKSFYRCFNGKIVNTYGPTEGTINNTYYDLDPDDERTVVPIGKPVANNRIYILSGDMSLLPIKTAGEICIAGASVARGYIGDHAKTLEQFVDNPFGEGKLYRSGDIGRWLEDGNIEILGRVDDQVKIRGHRIEPGEIETALNSHPDIDSCIVVPKGGQELQEKTRECKQCGIWSNYPGIVINKDDICNFCENFDRYKRLITQYFKTMDDLEQKIREGADRKKGKYDCLLVYACERVATYALYRLLDMGLNILTVTYDSGHYDQESLERISEITKKMGVDHFFLRHERSDEILKESLRSAQTMCKGCIHTSSSLAGEYAYKNGIPFVIGETLSRGQIVENKLYKFMDMGITDVNELEREIDKLTKNTALIDKKIYDIIGIDIVSDGTIYDRVEFLDFYRYCDVSHDEMIAYLDEKDSYWKDLDTKAIYSTDCKICQVGNFNHLKHKGFHYTGSAKSWDQRMGLTTLQNVKDDLYIDMTTEEHAAFLGELGYVPEKSDGAGGKYLCAYYIAENGRELTVSQLRNWLSGRIPEYMIPSFFIKLEEMPLTGNGKIDRKALPSPEGFRPKLSCTFVAPRTDMEKIIAGIWKEVLKTELAGVEDNFFDLGGSSLDIIQMGNKLQDITGKEIPVVTLFSNPTIAALAKHLDNGGESQTTAETAAQRKQTLDEGKNTMKQTFAKFGK